MKGCYTLSCDPAEKQYKLAAFWQFKGMFSRAIASYQSAIAQQPNFIPGHLKLGYLLEHSGQIVPAIESYRRAAELGAEESWLAAHINYLQAVEDGSDALDPGDLSSSHASNSQSLSAVTGATPAANKPMHVLLYTNCAETYGAEQVGHALMCCLARRGDRVSCVQSKASHRLIEERESLGIEHIWLEGDLHDFLYAATNAPEVTQVFLKARPDVIVFSDGEPMANLAASQVAARLKIPFIKIVHCVNAAWSVQFSAYVQWLPAIYQAAAAVVSVSGSNLQMMRDRFGLPAEIGSVIYNGRPEEYFATRDWQMRSHLRQSLNIPMDATVILTTARLTPEKGHAHQIKAMEQLQKTSLWGQLYFVWAGVGRTEQTLRQSVEAINAEAYVKFVGERSDIPALLNAADIFVLSSHYEGMPLSVMEAMAKGLAVVATAISGIPEELGGTGWLLNDPTIEAEKTVSDLVEALISLAQDKAQRQQLGRTAKRRAENHFKQEQALASYLHLIQQAVYAS